MAIVLRSCKNNEGTRRLLLCMSNGEYYVNIVEGDNAQTLISGIEKREEIKEIYLNMVWDLIN